MATNQRGHGKRVRVTATADRASGDLVVEDGFHGVCVNDAETGDRVTLDIEQVEHEIDAAGGEAIGDLVTVSGRACAKVTRIPGDEGVPTGKIWVLILPQPAA